MSEWPTSSPGAISAACSRPLRAILVGGVIVGVLDITYAIVVYSPRHPFLVLQAIASGFLGESSFSGGAKTAIFGLILHFLIAWGATAVFYLASRRFAFLVNRAVFAGVIYGALVYLFMHWVVLPLSAFPKGDTPIVYELSEFVEHWFCVGLPISLSVRHYSRQIRTSETSNASVQPKPARVKDSVL
jgi:uncharacterized membrane protein YagU involved in acid resistance